MRKILKNFLIYFLSVAIVFIFFQIVKTSMLVLHLIQRVSCLDSIIVCVVQMLIYT